MSAIRSQYSIAVIGAGSWGTAIGAWLARNGHSVRIWDIDTSVIDDINKNKCNNRYLPDAPLPDNIVGCHTLEQAMEQCQAAALAVPSRVFHTAIDQLSSHLDIMDKSAQPIVMWGTKGFAPKTGELLSTVAERALGDRAVTAVLSGPSFAYGVVRGQPAGFDLASKCEDQLEKIANIFRNEVTLVYTTADIVGVQVGGATKNVVAIAAGIGDGLNLGLNAHCLLVTRGLAEMNRLNVALGGKPETLMGLSGLGDLVLTCSGDLSRNRRFGLGLGHGKSVDDVLKQINQEVEGIQSTQETYEIGRKLNVFMPTTEKVYKVIFEGLSPLQAAQELMAIGPSLQAHS